MCCWNVLIQEIDHGGHNEVPRAAGPFGRQLSWKAVCWLSFMKETGFFFSPASSCRMACCRFRGVSRSRTRAMQRRKFSREFKIEAVPLGG